MSDEPIIEYLRSRAKARPPMDLVASIADAVEGVPQQRQSWFAPFVPASVAVAAAGVVVVAAILVGQGPDAGPPAGSPTEGGFASPTSEATPSPTPAPSLLRAGDSVNIDAVDSDGRWGSVTLTRGDDLGGYDDGSVPEDNFVVEVHVSYVADREPNPLMFGAPDWSLAGGAEAQSVGRKVPAAGSREGARPSLATYTGAIDIFATPLEGWLLFEVPRAAADFPLELRYQPQGLAGVATATYLRRPGAAPAPVAIANPASTPLPVTYVAREGYPFAVIESAEADELFATPDTCTNPVAGYTVTFPDEWFTNTEIGEWPACTWFSPTFYDVGDDPNEVPRQVVIVLVFGNISYGFTSEPDITHSTQIAVDGFNANRAELVGMTAPNGEYRPQPPTYDYTVYLGDQPSEEPTLRATTNFEGAADYELNKAVLDRIMALLVFDE